MPGAIGLAVWIALVPGAVTIVLAIAFGRFVPEPLGSFLIPGVWIGGMAVGLAAVLLAPRRVAWVNEWLMWRMNRTGASRAGGLESRLTADLAAGTVSRLECDVTDVWEVAASVDEDSPTYAFRVPDGRLLVISSQRLWDDLDASPDPEADLPRMVHRHITVEWFEHTGDLVGVTGRGEGVEVNAIDELFGTPVGVQLSISKRRECFVVDEEFLVRKAREKIARMR